MKNLSYFIFICATFLLLSCQNQLAQDPSTTADMILTNGKIATVKGEEPFVKAVAIKGGNILATGSDKDMLKLKGEQTELIDLNGRTAIPGLHDSHLHATRGGRFYNLELRWDGVSSLEEGLQMIKEQAERTPEG